MFVVLLILVVGWLIAFKSERLVDFLGGYYWLVDLSSGFDWLVK